MNNKLGIALLTATVLATTGCPPYPYPFGSYHFESDCTDSLCGFVVERGTANRVDGLIAGEHALSIGPDTEVSHAFSQQGSSTYRTVELLAKCDPGTVLRAEDFVTGQTPTEIIRSTATLVDVYDANPGRWRKVFATAFAPVNSASTPSPPYNVLSFHLITSGSGGCVVDDVVYGSAYR